MKLLVKNKNLSIQENLEVLISDNNSYTTDTQAKSDDEADRVI